MTQATGCVKLPPPGGRAARIIKAPTCYPVIAPMACNAPFYASTAADGLPPVYHPSRRRLSSSSATTPSSSRLSDVGVLQASAGSTRLFFPAATEWRRPRR
jgi:hypothetical protein